MSRHRDIRNLNIQGVFESTSIQQPVYARLDELDDHALSDGGDELTPDQEGSYDIAIMI